MSDQPTLPPRDPNVTIDSASVPSPDTATVPPASGEPGSGTLVQPPAALATFAPAFGYDILGELGRGGMGVVYRARQSTLNRVVALKMVLAGGRATDEDRVRFLAEGEAVAALSHPGIVQVHEFGTHNGEPYFALEFCPGGFIAQKLAGTPLPPREAAEVVEKVARAVQHAHDKGIVHRDLKPANVLLATDGTPKVTDFGLAKRVEGGAGLTQTGAIMGTPSYMAPEQAAGAKSVGPPADVYALGAILYECLTGRPPFRAATPLDTVLQVVSEEPVPLRQLNAQAPADLETAAHKCLQKEPGKRYGSAAALADDLGHWLRGEPITARPVGAGERLVRWAKRNRPLAAAITAAALFLIGGTVASTIGLVSASREAKRANDEKEKLDRMLSRTNFFLGQARSQEGRVVEAAALLDAVRLDDRGFEWGYVKRQNVGGYATLYGHPSEVGSVAFSPDGRKVASGCSGGMVKLWDAATGVELITLRGHTRGFTSVAFSPDGRRLASAGGAFNMPCEVRLWDAATGAELATLRGHANPVRSLAFSPDGRRLASAGYGSGVNYSKPGMLKLWDVATGAELATLSGHAQRMVSVAFSPNGRWLASAGGDNYSPSEVKLWDAETGADLATLRGHTNSVHSVAFSPDSRWLASGSGDRTVKLWDTASRAELATLRGHADAVLSVAFSPDGQRLASGSRDFDGRGLEELWTGEVKVWDAATGAELAALRPASSVSSVAFSPDGRRLALGGGDSKKRGVVKLWGAAAAVERATLRGHTNPVTSVAFSPDGRQLATGGSGGINKFGEAKLWDGDVKLWDAMTGAELAPLRRHNTNVVKSLAFSPDGRRLAAGGGGISSPGEVKIWDAATGAELATRSHAKEVWSVAFSPDGRRLASGGEDGAVMLWDAAAGTEPTVFHKGRGVVRAVAFSPDGRRLASGGEDGAVMLRDLATGSVPTILHGGYLGQVRSVAFSPDGQRLAAGGEAGEVRLWDAVTNVKPAILRGHAKEVTSVVFSPDGQRLASGSYDNTVKLWDANTGAELITLSGHTEKVSSVAFSPDGQRLAVGSVDGTVKLWDASDPTVVDEWELGLRAHHARVNPWWHQEQAEVAAKANATFAVAFHRGWVATAWPDDTDAWTQLDAACRQAGSPKQMLAACNRVLDANQHNTDARRRRAAYRGSVAAAVGSFAAGWPGLAPLADW